MAISKINVGGTEHTLEATKLVNTRYIDGVSFTGEANVTRYATCNTAAGNKAKTASITSGTFSLITGARVTVKFQYANSVSAPTLNVDGTGAKPIYWNDRVLTSNQYWRAGSVLDFVYNGTQWDLVGVARDNDTTYTSLKNPYSLTIQGNGTTLTNGTYDGSAAKTVDITPSSIGAAASSHTHREYASLVPYGTAIPANADLNIITYLKVGNYYCSKNVDAATLTNCPTTSAFMMQVISPLATTMDNESTGTWVYRLRKLQVYTGEEYIQYCYSSGTAGSWTYGEWKKSIKSDNTATTTAHGLLSAADKTKLDGIPDGGGGIPIVSAQSSDGITYTATSDRFSHTNGNKITIVPTKTSTSNNIFLIVNGTGANYHNYVYRMSSNGSGYVAVPTGFFESGRPYTLTYSTDGDYRGWFLDGYTKPSLADLQIENGGTGATTAADALNNLGAVGRIDTTNSATNGGTGEIFNVYSGDVKNIASGEYSHAEGLIATASGYGSHAEGQGTTASGLASHAEGILTKASRDTSHAEGIGAEASGVYSHAEGNFSIAYGDNSHAEGYETKAFGIASHAEGVETKVTNNASDTVLMTGSTTAGYAAHAEGYGTIAYGVASHAEGNGAKASGHSSHAEGHLSIASGEASHAEGIEYLDPDQTLYSTEATGLAAHAEGGGTLASGDYSHTEGVMCAASFTAAHAEGYYTVASGNSSHAEGKSTTASGSASHAEGKETKASAQSAHAEGELTIASSVYAHAEGYSTEAYGSTSHAEGRGTKAGATCSHAEGFQTTATNYASHAQGKYNKNMTAGGSQNNAVGDVMVIGNGTSSSALSNAFRVTYAGKAYGLSSFGSSGADYAEFFEWEDGNELEEDRVGYFVTMNGNHICKANPNDYILGVVSGEPCIIGNSDEDWQGRWLHDEFGRFIKEDVDSPVTEWKKVEVEILDEDGNPTGETKTELKEVETGEIIHGWRYKANPDYDSTQEYIERKDRKEWDAVGMLGVLSVRDDGTCEVNGYAKVAQGGIATKAESYIHGMTYRVIKRMSDNVVQIVFR